MFRITRPLVRLIVGLFTLVPALIGTAAYATTGPERPPSSQIPVPVPVSVPTTDTSFAQQAGWMASGVAVFLLLAAVVAGIAVLSRRHTVQTRQLQMP
jgi:hypothetical protein